MSIFASCKRGVYASFHLIACLIISLISVAPPLLGDFDKFENWGFQQGGGLRQENFVGDDIKLVITGKAWNQDKQWLALVGSLHGKPAVRAYDLSNDQPVTFLNWNGKSEFKGATATAVSWIPGSDRLLVGIQKARGEVEVLLLDRTTGNQDEPVAKKKLQNWDSLADLQPDLHDQDSGVCWVLGTKNEKGLIRKISVSSNSLNLNNTLLFSEITEPKKLIVMKDKFLAAGQNDQNEGIIMGKRIQRGANGMMSIFINSPIIFSTDNGRRSSTLLLAQSNQFENPILLGAGTFLSDLLVNQTSDGDDRLYVTGCVRGPGMNGENIFLQSFDLGESSIDKKWETNFDKAGSGIEIGVGLIGTSDGGVVLSGNFNTSWLLGQADGDDDFAALLPEGEDVKSFDSFLARYDPDGNLNWAQTSGMAGDDFAFGLSGDLNGSILLLGNRNNNADFGPYLAKVRIPKDGHPEKNAEMIPAGGGDITGIFWDPKTTLRFGEPVGSGYLSASGFDRTEKFSYSLKDKNEFSQQILSGDVPFFTPGELEITALMDGGQTAKRKITGLQGRPYMKVGYDVVNENKVHLWAELYGLHPTHAGDSDTMDDFLDRVRYEKIRPQGNESIPDGFLEWPNEFTGVIEVMGIFDENEHYEKASRKRFLHIEEGKLKEGEFGDEVILQVNDLKGPQDEQTVKIGMEVPVSAVQGFGGQRKFNKWIEFSEIGQTLRTARVQDPFSIRTTVIPEEAMTLFANYNFSFLGTVVNGYLAGSRVFLDLNFNGVHDKGEPYGYTNESGSFDIEINEEDGLAMDKNGNGMIDQEEGVLTAVNGTDHTSGREFEISYKAPPTYSVISAISTLITEVASNGYSLDRAEDIVVKSLNLQDGFDIGKFEPLSSAKTQSRAAVGHVFKSTQFSNLMNEGSRYIEWKTGHGIKREMGSSLVVRSLVKQILESAEKPGQTEKPLDTVDLTNKALLKSLLLDAGEEAKMQMANLGESYSIEDYELRLDLVSPRSLLANTSPQISERGENDLLDILVDNVSLANQRLEEFAESTVADLSSFKPLASAVQMSLDNLGEDLEDTLLVEEVEMLKLVHGANSPVVEELLQPSSQVISPEDLRSNSMQKAEEAFGQQVLSSVFAKKGASVFAPVLINSSVKVPDTINDDLMVGKFLAYDTEGDRLSYSLSGGNPDFDDDGNSILFINRATGELFINDLDDLKLMRQDIIETTLIVADQAGLETKRTVTVDLRKWTHLLGRPHFSEYDFYVAENLPAGTEFGNLRVLGTNGEVISDSPSYELIRVVAKGADPQLNDLTPPVSLSGDGVLSTTKIFDFEKESSYEVHIVARDGEGLFVNGVLNVRVNDEFRPIVRTVENELKLDDISITAMNYASNDPGVRGSEEIIPAGTSMGFLVLGLPGDFQLDSYKFSIVSGDSEDFILDNNGTIVTNNNIDYSRWLGSSLRCHLLVNGTYEFDFSVFIDPASDPELMSFEPWTISVGIIEEDDKTRLRGALLDEGTAEGIWEQGFVIGAGIEPDINDEKSQVFSMVIGNDDMNFEYLMGHWRFDGNTEDSSTNQNDGNLVGGEFVADRDGNHASALYLDGIADHVVVPHDESLNPIDQLSISVWLKIDDFSNIWSPVFQKGQNSITGGKHRTYALWASNNQSFRFSSAGNKSKNLHYYLDISRSEWFHYGVSLDRKNQLCKVFRNGFLIESKKDDYSNFNNNNDDLTVGTSSETTHSSISNFKGTIDDLRLYNLALKAWQFNQLSNPEAFAEKAFGINFKSKNLMGHWRFDDNTEDSSDNQNDGNLVGGEFVADREGNSASALYLDGIDDHVIVPHDESLNPLDQLSISVWLKIDEFSNIWSPIFQKGQNIITGGKHRTYALWARNNESFRFSSAGNNNVNKHYYLKISKSEWFHYGVSLDRKNQLCKVFRNGFLIESKGDDYSSFNNNNDDLTVGTSSETTNSSISNFNGTIDDLRLYNVALESYDYEQIINGGNRVTVHSLDSKKQFDTVYFPDNRDDSFYYRAYSINAEGISYGESIRVDNSGGSNFSTSIDGVELSEGWFESNWFGVFFSPNDDGWIMHQELGWLFVAPTNKGSGTGMWFWQEELGWLWISENTFPFLFSNSSENWLYFHGSGDQRILLYDYKAKTWISVKISFLVKP